MSSGARLYVIELIVALGIPAWSGCHWLMDPQGHQSGSYAALQVSERGP